MPLLKPAERPLLEGVSRLVYVNPFLPERVAIERQILGPAFSEAGSDWNVRPDADSGYPNLQRITALGQQAADDLRRRIAAGAKPVRDEPALYEGLVLFLLYHRYLERLRETAAAFLRQPDARLRVAYYASFARDAGHYLALPGLPKPDPRETAHLFACFFQVRRAFRHIFNFLIGASAPAVRLRAAIWQSIFTHDMRRYRRGLHLRMQDHTTLITGPSGTGKELVARAIGLSRYLPFDHASESFPSDPPSTFHAVNLSALSPTLIESELFGHRRGAFTGAVVERAGHLETCGPNGAVFLDEVGELDPAIQVKLLRVLQDRTFHRIGETRPRRFEGKVIAATNRDLAREIREGNFRADFYYRLCSDMIATPALAEQLRDDPGELPRLTLFLARQIVGPEEAAGLAEEVVGWIGKRLGKDYAWPGNVRELEQCVRSVLIRKEYHPHAPPEGPTGSSPVELAAAMASMSLSADELLRRYCTLAYAKTGSYLETARRLGIDRRTVKQKVDAAAD
ncbi:MAG: sigma 54-interacting transcriptional regulator [Planctomycetota bacterium]|nr:sigma 54-interacting transcriptional regulator [Planctomycetota bacterium]